MAFKSVNAVKAEKHAGKFILENDGDSAFVIFLWRNDDEMLAAGTHYIKSNEFNGYVQCLETADCPACKKGLRVQQKLFVPMLVLSINGQSVNEIQFWDRNLKFEPVLRQAIFKNYANPSEYIFQITRRGAFGSKETRYDIAVAGANKATYDQIMSDNNATFPAFYDMVCKDIDAATMSKYLATAAASNVASNTAVPEYVATPRVSVPTNNSAQSILADVEAPFDTDDDIPEDVDFGA